jgi:peroxiredoxin Q/BCP
VEQLVDGAGEALAGLLDLALQRRHLVAHAVRLSTTFQDMTRLSPGDTAPDFTLATDTGEEVTLSDLRGRKVIVYFYPAAMTPGCTKQACDFTDSLDSLQAAGYTVLGISPDKPEKLAKFRERDALTITLLSDPDRSTLAAYGAFGEKKLYGKVVEGVIRSTFVVDEDGTIEVAQYNVKATGHVAKLRKDLGLAS